MKTLKLNITPAAPAVTAPDRAEEAFLQLAATRAEFDPGGLRSVLASHGLAAPENTDKLVAKYCYDYTKTGKYCIRDFERNEILKRMGAARIRELLSWAPSPDGGNVTQKIFSAYSEGRAPDLKLSTLDELVAIHSVSKWLQGTGIQVPAEVDVLFYVKQESILRVCKKLTRNFKGRQSELNKLSDYVDWLPKTSLSGSAAGFFRNIIRWYEKPPMLIMGIGGIGKSTLVSKFILDHLESPQRGRLPFIYLDFDKPGLSIANTIDLAREGLRQLAIQFPSNEGIFNEIGNDLQTYYGSGGQANPVKQSHSRGSDRAVLYQRYQQRYSAQLLELRSPILVVFDSFEEVQYRASPSDIFSLFNFVQEISELLPRLRVVFAGRSEIPRFNIEFEVLKLELFDQPSAVGFLASMGVSDETLARNIYEQFGGNPLTLQLASEVIKKENIGSGGKIDNIATRTKLFSRLDETLVQEQLVRRNLEHAHNEKVATIAIPGILVRKINVGVIREVLAGPCGLPAMTDPEAATLMTDLQKETFLISESGSDIFFRQDLRSSLYGLIMKNPKYKGREIQDAAIRYYQDSSAPEDKAEYIYHRLMRGDDPSVIENIYDEKVRPFIENSLSELPDNGYLYLARKMGVTATAARINRSNLRQWEEYRRSEIIDAFEKGDEAALRRVREDVAARSERSFNSPLHYQEAKVFLRLGEFDAAEKIILAALKEINTDDTMGIVNLMLLRSASYEYRLDFKTAYQVLAESPLLQMVTGTALQISHGVYSDPGLVVQLLDGILTSFRLAKRIGTEREDAIFNTIRGFVDNNSNSNILSAIWDRLLHGAYIFDALAFPYRTYALRPDRKVISMDIQNLLDNVWGFFSAENSFRTRYDALRGSVRNRVDLETTLQQRYKLNLKDICEPGVFEVNLVDAVKFIELDDSIPNASQV